MNKKLIKAAIVGALVSVAPISFAADEVEDIKAPTSILDELSFSANVGLYSDYIFRGYTQTKHEPAIQGGFDVEHSSGLYMGTWASNVKWTTEGGYMDDNDLEIDVYGGFAFSAGPVDLDVGVLQFLYPGENTLGAAEADATELYAGISHDLILQVQVFTTTTLFQQMHGDFLMQRAVNIGHWMLMFLLARQV